MARFYLLILIISVVLLYYKYYIQHYNRETFYASMPRFNEQSEPNTFSLLYHIFSRLSSYFVVGFMTSCEIMGLGVLKKRLVHAKEPEGWQGLLSLIAPSLGGVYENRQNSPSQTQSLSTLQAR